MKPTGSLWRVVRVRERRIGHPTELPAPTSGRNPAPQSRERRGHSDHDDDSLAAIQSTAPHRGSLPEVAERSLSSAVVPCRSDPLQGFSGHEEERRGTRSSHQILSVVPVQDGWAVRDLNPRPLACHASALPTAPTARSRRRYHPSRLRSADRSWRPVGLGDGWTPSAAVGTPAMPMSQTVRDGVGAQDRYQSPILPQRESWSASARAWPRPDSAWPARWRPTRRTGDGVPAGLDVHREARRGAWPTAGRQGSPH